jgi:uncharacterized protein
MSKTELSTSEALTAAINRSAELRQPIRIQQAVDGGPSQLEIGRVEQVIETHISWIFLTGEWALKVKRPVRNPFLDYADLQRRRHMCEEEIRLDRRYAPELYVGMVGFIGAEHDDTLGDGDSRMDEGAGQSERAGGSERLQLCGADEPPTGTAFEEWAVVMRRFDGDALLSSCLQSIDNSAERDDDRSSFPRAGFPGAGDLPAALERLAVKLADFHHDAARAANDVRFGSPQAVWEDALGNFESLLAADAPTHSAEQRRRLEGLQAWTEQTFEELGDFFASRKTQGHVRECHGDLHSGNVVWWQGALTPFDGIEFNDEFRWIDTQSDVAFLTMDLRAKGYPEWSHTLLNAYLERNGDYAGIPVCRWYNVYRALVRAKVANILMQQHHPSDKEYARADEERSLYIRLAHELSKPTGGKLWITYGVSGSGKSFGAKRLVERAGAIRIRSDVERKRLLGYSATSRPTDAQSAELYDASMTERVYERLADLAQYVLAADRPVVIDATCLQRWQRDRLREVACDANAVFGIIPFEADRETLTSRVRARNAANADPSDAGLEVLDGQLQSLQPLDDDEQDDLHELATLL